MYRTTGSSRTFRKLSHGRCAWLTALILAAPFLTIISAANLFGSPAYAVDKARAAPNVAHLADAADDDLAFLDRVSQAFNRVATTVRPSVVSIQSRSKTGEAPWHRDIRRRLQPDIPDDDLPNFSVGAGSGVILDAQGHILTNHHVVHGAGRIDVTLADGREFKAGIVGTDRMTDVAVIKINARDLHPARFGDSDLADVGHLVLAVGRPFGFEHTVTHGIISAKGRNDVGVGIDYQDFIQTDAAINPGNSGGPLINTRGEVIGINTAIATATGGSQGVSFAIPANKARRIAARLITDGRIVRGYLGVTIQPPDEVLASRAGLEAPRGAVIGSTSPDGPAAASGLKPNDLIISVGDREVRNPTELQELIASTPPGETVKVLVWRKGQRQTLDVTVGKQPEGFRTRGFLPSAEEPLDEEIQEDEDDEVEQPRTMVGEEIEPLGIRVATVSPELIARYSLRGVENGAVVTWADPIGEGFSRGLRPGDVIIRVDSERVRNVADLTRLLTPEALAEGVRLTVKDPRSGNRYVGIRIE
jgi:serine protease Do